jgi:hypothetical protein
MYRTHINFTNLIIILKSKRIGKRCIACRSRPYILLWEGFWHSNDGYFSHVDDPRCRCRERERERGGGNLSLKTNPPPTWRQLEVNLRVERISMYMVPGYQHHIHIGWTRTHQRGPKSAYFFSSPYNIWEWYFYITLVHQFYIKIHKM